MYLYVKKKLRSLLIFKLFKKVMVNITIKFESLALCLNINNLVSTRFSQFFCIRRIFLLISANDADLLFLSYLAI